MLCREVFTVFSVCFLAIASGMPEGSGNANKDVAFGLPFLQFTNGGIRFNFGGYHAEAGLGGLLGGSRTGGGLHASAGTPWGANAAAGLGGLLSGDNANTGGGLYARAGLGDGRPEAAAGLGGVLDGSGRSIAPLAGGLFAGATTGGRGIRLAAGNAGSAPAAGVNVQTNAGGDVQGSAGGNVQGSAGGDVQGSTAAIAEGKPSRGRTNIQIISRGGKKPEKTAQVTGEVTATAEVPVQKGQVGNKEVREVESPKAVPIASGGIFGSVFVNPVPVGASVEKVKIIGAGTIEPAPPVPLLSSEVNEIVQLDNRPTKVKIVYPKLVVRKRFWGPRKQIIYTTSDEVEEPVAAGTRKLRRRQAEEYPIRATATTNTPANSNGYFDDVFKIPVSTLNAVNQLLNNNAG